MSGSQDGGIFKMIRKGRIYRYCKKCGALFEPKGKFNRVCKNCNPIFKKGDWLRDLAKKHGKKRFELNHI